VAPSPLSSTSGIPPVSSSRERIVDSASRRPVSPPSSATPAAGSPPSLGRSSLPSEALDAADRALEAMGRFRRAEAALTKGDHASAEAFAEEAIALDPEPVEYRATLAWIRAQSSAVEQLPSIVGAMTDLLVEHPDHARVLLYRARLLRRQGRIREAIADYEAHLRVRPKSKEALAELEAIRPA
jgi:tetratricopeptide (TPR) repeat protein